MPDLIGAYRPISGVPDEMVAPDGTVKPGWFKFMSALDALGAEELTNRFQHADQYLRDAGVFYRMYDGLEQGERDWPLEPGTRTIDDLVTAIGADEALLADALNEKSVRFIVNEMVAARDASIGDEDEIAFLPPVSGG